MPAPLRCERELETCVDTIEKMHKRDIRVLQNKSKLLAIMKDEKFHKAPKSLRADTRVAVETATFPGSRPASGKAPSF